MFGFWMFLKPSNGCSCCLGLEAKWHLALPPAGGKRCLDIFVFFGGIHRKSLQEKTQENPSFTLKY